MFQSCMLCLSSSRPSSVTANTCPPFNGAHDSVRTSLCGRRRVSLCPLWTGRIVPRHFVSLVSRHFVSFVSRDFPACLVLEPGDCLTVTPEILHYSRRYCNIAPCRDALCISNLCNTSNSHAVAERWGAGVETQKNVWGEIGGWGRVPFNESYAPSHLRRGVGFMKFL